MKREELDALRHRISSALQRKRFMPKQVLGFIKRGATLTSFGQGA